MKKQKLRDDKTCQNCGAEVPKTFCPECGQKNTETRKTFYALFADFITSFVNYDNSFWRTTRDMFTSPGKLTKEYLAGRRKSYVNPVKLYLFASFMAFFIPVLMEYVDSLVNPKPEGVIETPKKRAVEISPIEDAGYIYFRSAPKNEKGEKEKPTIDPLLDYGWVSSIAQLDSIHYSRPKSERISQGKYYGKKFKFFMKEKVGSESQQTKINRFIEDNLPKVLFLYMPVFAFFLWLFHNKKKWYYFDSGVFTLHFFSLFLLVIAALTILSYVFEDWLGWDDLNDFITLIGIFYITFFFFRANRNFYGESRAVSNLKATALFFINTFFMLIALILFFVVAVVV